MEFPEWTCSNQVVDLVCVRVYPDRRFFWIATGDGWDKKHEKNDIEWFRHNGKALRLAKMLVVRSKSKSDGHIADHLPDMTRVPSGNADANVLKFFF